jgi:hypothetical protein
MERQTIIQRKTGRLLGHCDAVPLYGKYYIRPYMTERCLTSMRFRCQWPANRYWSKYPRIIAYGYKDAGLFLGFKRWEPWKEEKNES